MWPSLRSFIEKLVNALNGRVSSKRESVGLVNRLVPSKPGTPKNGFGSSWSQNAAAAAERHVALALELRRRLVEAVPVRLDVVGCGCRRSSTSSATPHGSSRWMPAENWWTFGTMKSGFEKLGLAAEERARPERAARRLLDPVRPRVAQRVGRRAVVVVRGDHRRRQAEPVAERLGGGVQVVLAVAGAQHRLLVDRVRHAGAQLEVVLVELPRRLGRAVDADEADAADHRLAHLGRHRVGQRRVERVVQPVLFLADRAVAIPAEAEVDRSACR